MAWHQTTAIVNCRPAADVASCYKWSVMLEMHCLYLSSVVLTMPKLNRTRVGLIL